MANRQKEHPKAAPPPESYPVQVDAPAGLMKPRQAASGSWPQLDEDDEPMFDAETGKPLTIPWVISPNQVYDAEDPLVKGWPHLFVPATPTNAATAHPAEASGA